MLIVAVNQEGLYFDFVQKYWNLDTGKDEYELKFTAHATCATRFHSDTLEIPRKDSAWKALFEAEARQEVAFVPHPQYAFDGIMQGLAMYSRTAGLSPSHRFEKKHAPISDWQWAILQPLYLAADEIGRAEVELAESGGDEQIRRSLEREHDRLNCSIWRLHYDFGLLKQEDVTAQWEREIGEVLFSGSPEIDGETFEMEVL